MCSVNWSTRMKRRATARLKWEESQGNEQQARLESEDD